MDNLKFFCALVALALLVSPGCGGSDQLESVEISGTVTFDGEPVKEGEIVFRAADAQVRSCGGPITDGKFSFKGSPGAKKVEITAMREVPGKMDTTSNPGEESPLMEMYIPAEYNDETTLTADVPESGKKTFQFDLKSGK